MRSQEELKAEISRLSQLRNLDESGMTVKLITLIALEWMTGVNPVSPSDRLMEVGEEMTFDGAIDLENGNEPS